MDNLQTEVLELEFYEFSKGNLAITEVDFAKILLRYTYLVSFKKKIEYFVNWNLIEWFIAALRTRMNMTCFWTVYWIGWRMKRVFHLRSSEIFANSWTIWKILALQWECTHWQTIRYRKVTENIHSFVRVHVILKEISFRWILKSS